MDTANIYGGGMRGTHEANAGLSEMRALSDISKPPAGYPVNFLNLFCCRESEFYGGLRVRKRRG